MSCRAVREKSDEQARLECLGNREGICLLECEYRNTNHSIVSRCQIVDVQYLQVVQPALHDTVKRRQDELFRERHRWYYMQWTAADGACLL